jgi:hypothetical protein
MKKQILITAVFLLGLFIRMSLAVEFTLLGPSKYLRTRGKPDVYNDTFCGTIGQGKLILTNGTSDGKNRTSSASILINGQQVLGPSDFNQQVYKLEVPINLIENNTISVRLASAPESYITVKITEEVPADATASGVIGSQGGIVSVQNHLGDKMTLEIPPLALTGSVPISLTALAVPPPNPICTNIFPGVVLEPSGIIFSLPAKIKVDFHDAISNPSSAMLFWLKNSNCVVPIGNHAGTQNGIEGETTHFSPIIVGAPTADEIFMQIAEIIVRGGDTSALGILETIDDYYAIMRFAETLRILGEDQKAAEAENSARGLLQERTLQLLSSPQPANPCGHYSNALKQLSDLIIAALGDTSLAELVTVRSCTLTVTPSSPNLSPGDTVDLTAVLTDPTGSQHTCSSLPWYSSNLDVAQIALTTGSSCTIKAGIEGTANISANCDGLIGSAKVTVEGVSTYVVTWNAVIVGDYTCITGGGLPCNDYQFGVLCNVSGQADGSFQGEAVLTLSADNVSKVVSVTASGTANSETTGNCQCACPDPTNPGKYIGYPWSITYIKSWQINNSSIEWLKNNLRILKQNENANSPLIFYMFETGRQGILGYYNVWTVGEFGICPGMPDQSADNPHEGYFPNFQFTGVIPASDATGDNFDLSWQTTFDPEMCSYNFNGTSVITWKIKIQKVK